MKTDPLSIAGALSGYERAQEYTLGQRLKWPGPVDLRPGWSQLATRGRWAAFQDNTPDGGVSVLKHQGVADVGRSTRIEVKPELVAKDVVVRIK